MKTELLAILEECEYEEIPNSAVYKFDYYKAVDLLEQFINSLIKQKMTKEQKKAFVEYWDSLTEIQLQKELKAIKELNTKQEEKLLEKYIKKRFNVK